jgi:hypothetical protein
MRKGAVSDNKWQNEQCWMRKKEKKEKSFYAFHFEPHICSKKKEKEK